MKSEEIRSSFLEFFRERGHAIERSDRLVPRNDPTLLFTSAGMVQFKPYYTGQAPVPYRRAATVQKCLRAGGKANDLDEVGKTSRHLTFFEMLGNFSFGDYFKRETIAWGWEYVTRVLHIPAERVWVSVYLEDDEAAEIWEKEIGVPASRIVRLGAKDNFWGPAGDTGACGPCSELLFDRGAAIDPNATLENDPHERFIEFWNFVFPQYDQQPDGTRPPLKNRGIDTGMGLERMAALLQGRDTVFDTDGIRPIIAATASLTRVAYPDRPVPYRVIADHTRALSFMIADGILPSNEGRGYVMRRLLRRAARFGRELGLEKPFLHQVARTVIDLMGRQYPELTEGRLRIEKVILSEEERFAGALARGMELLGHLFDKMKSSGTVEAPGEELFKLHDTYGFPFDLACDMIEEQGFTADRAGFDAALNRQREMARGAWAGSGQQAVSPIYQSVLEAHGNTEFVGYEQDACETAVVALIHDEKETDLLEEGATGEVVLHTSPFYAESGGQISDIGILETAAGTAEVTAVLHRAGKSMLHRVRVLSGRLRVGDTASARIDADRRRCTEAHHTATHLLQAALRQVLGEHVHQAGSHVGPDRLRFDFTHFEAIPPERLQDIERLANEYIRANAAVDTQYASLEDARAAGATALFGEKYEDRVRMVRTGGISLELCGGCHVGRTGTIGLCKIVGESAISAGVRRIEAVCGAPAIEFLQARERSLLNALHLLSARPEDLEGRIGAILEDNKRLNREVEKWKQAAATGGGMNASADIREIQGIRTLIKHLPGQEAKSLRMILDRFKDQLGSGVVVLGSDEGGKASLAAGVTTDLTGRIQAGAIIGRLAPLVGGGGGGRPDMAQAGGKDVEKLQEALRQAPAIIEALLK